MEEDWKNVIVSSNSNSAKPINEGLLNAIPFVYWICTILLVALSIFILVKGIKEKKKSKIIIGILIIIFLIILNLIQFNII